MDTCHTQRKEAFVFTKDTDMEITVHKESLSRINGWEKPIDCLERIRKDESTSDRILLHYHEYIELLYGLSGRSQVMIGKQTYSMHKGDLIVVKAGEAHEVLCTEGETSYFVIKFLPDILYAQSKSLLEIRYLLALWQNDISFNPAIDAESLRGSGIDGYITEIMQENRCRTSGYELVLYANVMRIFVWILRNRCSLSLPPEDISSSTLQALERVLEEAEKHIYDDFTAEDAARFCHLSYSHFSRSFKHAFGISFSAYSEALRLRESERLLLTTHRDITDIASSLGFSSTSYFTERFRLRYGSPPHRFRAMKIGIHSEKK